MFSFKKDNIDLVLAVIDYYSFGSCDKKQAKKVQRFIKKCNNNRILTLASAAKLIENPTTPKELYAVSTAYFWAGAEYRNDAVYWLKKYIDIGGTWEGTPKGEILGVSQLDMNRANNYVHLAECYERECKFIEAIQAYNKAIKECPAHITTYLKLANCYKRFGKIDAAIIILKDALRTVVFNAHDARDINIEIIKLESDKKNNGDKYSALKNFDADLLNKLKLNIGIRQSEFYKMFPTSIKAELSERLYWLSKSGVVRREKSGNTYRLYISEAANI